MKRIKEIAQNEEGSALATVLVIAVVISLFIGAILSGIVLQSRFIQKDINSFKALYVAEEGVYRFLNEYSITDNFQANQTVILSNGDEAEITATPFGGFLDVESTTQIYNQQRTVRVLTGDKSSSVFRAAIALGDTNSALTVTGSTVVKGDMITSGRGIQTESFKGVPFRGSLEGIRPQFNEENAIPILSTNLFELQELAFNELFENQNLRRFNSQYNGSSSLVPNLQKDTLYYTENTEWISNQRVLFPMDLVVIVDGNFIINGDYQFSPFTKVIVRDTLLVGGAVSGKNVLLYAGKSIQIGGGASISAQVLSEGTIAIRDDAYLKYPSLVYSSKEFYEEGAREVINIRGQSIVDGTVIYPIQTNTFNQDLFRVRIDTNATVRGSIYNLGQTELLGTVLGTVITNQFYFYDSPTSYINWLKDVTIDVSQRPENYVLPFGFTDSTNYAILDWYELE